MKKYRASSLKKAARVIALAGTGVALLAQLVRPTRENPPSDPVLSIRAHKVIPPEILSTLERSCFDCHSNETRWPWYSAVTPINFLVAEDVNKARKRLNFSEWGKNKPVKMQGLLQMIDDQVSLKDMPLPGYLSLHPGASLSSEEIQAISEWVYEEQARLSEPAGHAQENKQ